MLGVRPTNAIVHLHFHISKKNKFVLDKKRRGCFAKKFPSIAYLWLDFLPHQHVKD